MLSACVLAMPAAAEDCAVVESRASLAALTGARIASVEIVTEGPEVPRLAQPFSGLHPVSRQSTIRRQLLFAPGDTVDTLLVGETMRRLRRQRLFGDVVLQARRCGVEAVALVLRTRDTWTLRPRAQIRPPSTVSVGVEERNFLGTGRSVALTSEMTTRGKGAAFTLSDPWLLGSNVAGHLRIASLGGSHTFRSGVRNHEYSVFQPWHAEAGVARLSFGDTAAADRALHSVAAMTMFGHRIGGARTGGARTGVTLLVVGAEFDSATTISATRRGADPAVPHVRSFLGVGAGISRRTAVFDTVSWIVPGRGFLDVGLGFEGEAFVSGGRDRVLDVPVLKADAWLGRVWLPRRGSVLMVDAWSSGYLGRLVDANHIERISAVWFAEAPRGMWGARLTAERLLELDPDRRSLSLMQGADYTAPAVRPFVTRAGRALAASVERSAHVRRAGHSSMLDAGAFLASSYRWQVAEGPDGQLRATVVGGRLRLLSANGAVSSVRLDVGYPVALAASLPRRPFAVVTFGSLFDVSRQRDGRRVY